MAKKVKLEELSLIHGKKIYFVRDIRYLDIPAKNFILKKRVHFNFCAINKKFVDELLDYIEERDAIICEYYYDFENREVISNLYALKNENNN